MIVDYTKKLLLGATILKQGEEVIASFPLSPAGAAACMACVDGLSRQHAAKAEVFRLWDEESGRYVCGTLADMLKPLGVK
jgi:hypothetical protein